MDGVLLFYNTLSITFRARGVDYFSLPMAGITGSYGGKLAQWGVTYLADLSASTSLWTDTWICSWFCLGTMTMGAGFFMDYFDILLQSLGCLFQGDVQVVG